MKHLHLVKVRFDRRTSEITDDWLRRRFGFFVENTCRSLALQTNRDWKLWIQFQDGMEDISRNLLLLLAYSSDLNCEIHVSFGDEPLPLSPEVRDGKAYVYVTRIDSDDLFAPDACEIISQQFPKVYGDVEGLLFRKGWLHDLKTGKTGVYISRSGPFHTIMYPMGVFTDPVEYGKWWSKIGDHSRVASNIECQNLPDYKFCVLIHGDNFLSTFDYGREKGAYVPVGWSVDRFLDPPVVFDVDDFSDKYGGGQTIDDLLVLKDRYPKFKCSLFTIPARTHHTLLQRAVQHDWIELLPHGWTHEPVEELKTLSPHSLVRYLDVLPHDDIAKWGKVFRPPGWYITKDHITLLSRLGYSMALNKRDHAAARTCPNGYYENGEVWESWHGHTHDVCGNYLRAHLPDLLKKWRVDQPFAFVSEAVTVKS